MLILHLSSNQLYSNSGPDGDHFLLDIMSKSINMWLRLLTHQQSVY